VRRQKILAVVGTRPNFMKIAPVQAALAGRPDAFEVCLVHTGQHYDAAMSDVFLTELGIGAPDHLLGVGSGTHTQQAARVIERLEPVLERERPDLVLVPGDVNSTLAAALAAVMAGIPVGHVEAGLRSFDRSMPEEINRVLTDQVSDLLFTHSPEAEQHLRREGHDASAIHYVGNTMIDTLVALRDSIDSKESAAAYGLDRGRFLLVTLHRPALVDGPLLEETIAQLAALGERLPVLFPAHPRTRKAMVTRGLDRPGRGLEIVEPLGYLEFLSLLSQAGAVLTDSGGIQEEATFLGIPCFTLRDNTERPVTVDMGTNLLLGLSPPRIAEIPDLISEVRGRPAKVPPLWDGAAATRIVDVLARRAG
jgi:UDP-N-acetylglucosamine 2-epimerase (non-hydrolysing)